MLFKPDSKFINDEFWLHDCVLKLPETIAMTANWEMFSTQKLNSLVVNQYIFDFRQSLTFKVYVIFEGWCQFRFIISLNSFRKTKWKNIETALLRNRDEKKRNENRKRKTVWSGKLPFQSRTFSRNVLFNWTHLCLHFHNVLTFFRFILILLSSNFPIHIEFFQVLTRQLTQLHLLRVCPSYYYCWG